MSVRRISAIPHPQTYMLRYRFLQCFGNGGFQKLEIATEKTSLGGQIYWLAPWACDNGLLTRGVKGYYMITEKGKRWLDIAEELVKIDAFGKIGQLYEMSSVTQHTKPKHDKKPKAEKVAKECPTCRIIQG